LKSWLPLSASGACNIATSLENCNFCYLTSAVFLIKKIM
jgi:hypothetical protein